VLSSHARVVTEQPERYVKQLVSHLSHRLSTQVTDGEGVIEVERGRCTLTPRAGVLLIAAVAEDEPVMLRIQDVVGRHLERFGARAGLTVEWSAVTGTPGGATGSAPPRG
jgi:caffeoyl-CoA O-methyltransferase